MPDINFGYRSCREKLLQQFGTVSLEGFGCENLRSGVRAAGALLAYVQETQKQSVQHIGSIETYFLDQYLWIEELSCRNLELVANMSTGSQRGTLLNVLDRTLTAMGGRLLKKWLRYPSIDAVEINTRLDAVAEGKKAQGIRKKMQNVLKSIADMERLCSKITMGHCNARDFLALKRSLQTLPEIEFLAGQLEAQLFKPRQDWSPHIILAEKIEVAIRDDAPLTVNEGGMIKTGYHAELDELVRISRDGKGWLTRLEVKEKEATGISALKVRYNKVFGYFIEVPKSRIKNVPPRYVRKQTLVNAERYITDELKKFETKVLNAEDQRAALEYEIFQEVRTEVIHMNRGIQETAQFIARFDCLLTLADIADQNGLLSPGYQCRRLYRHYRWTPSSH